MKMMGEFRKWQKRIKTGNRENFQRSRGLWRVFRLNLKILCGGCLTLLLCLGAMITAGAATAEEEVEIPVVMYHALLKDTSRLGKYVISPAEFESDLVYLEEHGYHTLLMEDLIAYTQGGKLPEKPILLTFDDGYYNNYLYAFQIAKEHNVKFVISPIAYWSDQYSGSSEENAYYSHATWKELREMADSGLVEVQNHSYDLHESGGRRLGVKRIPGESEAQYEALLREDLLKAQKLITEGVGKKPTTFVYPFGALSKETPAIIKKLGFSATLSCEEKISKVTRDPDSLYGLGRFLRVSGVSSQRFFEETMGLKP